MENPSVKETNILCHKKRFSADFIRRQPEYRFLIASIRNGTYKPRSYGSGAECEVRDDKHLEILRQGPARPATAAACRSIGLLRGHKASIILEKPPLERSVSSLAFSELSKTLASMTIKDEPRISIPPLSSKGHDKDTREAKLPTTTSGPVDFHETAVCKTPKVSSSSVSELPHSTKVDPETTDTLAEGSLSGCSGYISESQSSLSIQTHEIQSDIEKSTTATRPNIEGTAPNEERKPKKSVHIQSEVEVYPDNSCCEITETDDSIDQVASENARAYNPNCLDCLMQEDCVNGGTTTGAKDSTCDHLKPPLPPGSNTRVRKVGVVHTSDQLLDLQPPRKPSHDASRKCSDNVPSQRASMSSLHNHLSPDRRLSSAPSQHSGSDRKTSSAAGFDGASSRRRVSVISHTGGTTWYDPMVERSTKLLRGREPKFSQCDQYLQPARPGLTRLQISYTQTNTAHNDRVIFSDLLVTAHRRNIVMNQGIRSLERRLKARRDDVTRATTFYDRYAPLTSASLCQAPPRRRKVPGTVAQKKRERKERIKKKNQDIKLGYIPTADTLKPPSPRDIARLTDCRYLRVDPERLRLIRAYSYFR